MFPMATCLKDKSVGGLVSLGVLGVLGPGLPTFLGGALGLAGLGLTLGFGPMKEKLEFIWPPPET